MEAADSSLDLTRNSLNTGEGACSAKALRLRRWKSSLQHLTRAFAANFWEWRAGKGSAQDTRFLRLLGTSYVLLHEEQSVNIPKRDCLIISDQFQGSWGEAQFSLNILLSAFNPSIRPQTLVYNRAQRRLREYSNVFIVNSLYHTNSPSFDEIWLYQLSRFWWN